MVPIRRILCIPVVFLLGLKTSRGKGWSAFRYGRADRGLWLSVIFGAGGRGRIIAMELWFIAQEESHRSEKANKEITNDSNIPEVENVPGE